MANYAQRNYDAGYAAAQSGKPAQTNTSHPEYQYWIAGYNDYNKKQSTSNSVREMFSGMSEMFAPMEITFPEYDGPSAEEISAENKKNSDISRRNTLFSGYVTAADTAADYINNQINEERANAALLGIDYQLTDELKQQRINKYFDTLWGAGDELELDNLIKEYGNPTGFDGKWTIRRTKDTPADEAAPIPYEGIMTAGGPIKKNAGNYAGLAPEDRNARPIPQNALIVEYGGAINNPSIFTAGSRAAAGPNKAAAAKTPIVAGPKVGPTTGILATGKTNDDDISLLGKRTTLG